MSAEPVLVTSGLEAVFPGGDGVGPVDIVVTAGERVLVVGPSGSGKSTLLRLFHGAIPQAIHARTGGTVSVLGRDVGERTVAELADVVGVVAQDPASGVCLTQVDDEVAFALENQAVPAAEIGPRVAAALAQVGAGGLAGRPTAELSGGELQRVALAAALVTEPALLLLDEPTAMLDADGVAMVRSSLSAVGPETAVVLVEHRLDDVAADAGLAGLPPRWVVLDRSGRVIHDGPASALTPADLRRLVEAGCWLPLAVELDVLSPVPESEPAPSVPPGPVRLQATGLAVAPGGVARGRRSGAPLLADVDLTLRAGEVVALVGRNGSGKSTLLAALAGLVPAIAGRVVGECGLVFQNPGHQFARSTVRDEVGHGLPGDAADRVGPMLERFDLLDFADRSPHHLSGGQQRRLSLAAMLVHGHGCLLADEPTFGLDRRAASEALRALAEAAGEGRAVLFSTHDARALATHAHRVLVLAQGRVVADTDPRTLLLEAALTDAAGLRPSGALARLAAETESAAELRARLQALDDAVLAGSRGVVP